MPKKKQTRNRPSQRRTPDPRTRPKPSFAEWLRHREGTHPVVADLAPSLWSDMASRLRAHRPGFSETAPTSEDALLALTEFAQEFGRADGLEDLADVRVWLGMVFLMHREYEAHVRPARPSGRERRLLEELMRHVRDDDEFETWCREVEARAGAAEPAALAEVPVVRSTLSHLRGEEADTEWNDREVAGFLVEHDLGRKDGRLAPWAREVLLDGSHEAGFQQPSSPRVPSQQATWNLRDLTARWLDRRVDGETAVREALVAGLLHAVGGQVRLGDLECLARAQNAVDEFAGPGSTWFDDDHGLGFLSDELEDCGVVRDGLRLTVPAGLGPAVALFARRAADRHLVRREVVATWREVLENPERGLAVTSVAARVIVQDETEGVRLSVCVPA